jgi:hypothetical protein
MPLNIFPLNEQYLKQCSKNLTHSHFKMVNNFKTDAEMSKLFWGRDGRAV